MQINDFSIYLPNQWIVIFERLMVKKNERIGFYVDIYLNTSCLWIYAPLFTSPSG